MSSAGDAEGEAGCASDSQKKGLNWDFDMLGVAVDRERRLHHLALLVASSYEIKDNLWLSGCADLRGVSLTLPGLLRPPITMLRAPRCVPGDRVRGKGQVGFGTC